jgi:hypothetical protein
MTKRLLLLLFIGAASFASSAQDGYWQQNVNYCMDIDFNAENHTFQGAQSLVYTNNSPDTLDHVFYHLYFNAFQPGSMMDVRSRTIADPDPRIADRINNLQPNEIGFHKIEKLTQDGEKVTFSVEGTVAEVQLAQPLLPGKSTTFEMKFYSQVPIQIRRSGRNNEEGIDYTLTQWYPKLAEYDRDGWHSEPYVSREFHGVFGTFEVDITIDSKYTLAGTGIVQNPNEVGHGYSETTPASEKTTWKFKAENVHDFAWAADAEYTHLQSTLSNGTELHFFHRNDSIINQSWTRLVPFTEQLFNIMNDKFGVYPYAQFSVIQGGDGGMEYPMCTMISGTGSFGGLVSVTVHEAIHNWYYGVLASNEQKYPWMDEGFTTFAQNIVLDSLFKRNNLNPQERSQRSYISNALSGKEEPLSTGADYYETNRAYGSNAYSKGCVFLDQLSGIVGQETFDQAIMRYFNQWKFKHPTPLDFKRIMEKASNMELDWYFDAWIGTTKTIDYGIHTVTSSGKKTIIEIQRIGSLAMPLELKVTSEKGVQYSYIPLEIMRGAKPAPNEISKDWKQENDWPWAYPFYRVELTIPFESIKRIELDPFQKIADLDSKNDAFPSGNISFPPK